MPGKKPQQPQVPSVHSVSMSKYQAVDICEKESRNGWVEFGVDNLFPQYLIELGNESPLHSTLCKQISQAILGKGLESNLPATRTKLAQFRINKKVLPGICHDVKKNGGYYPAVVWSKDNSQINEINSIPIEYCLVNVAVDTDEITGVRVSKNRAQKRKDRYTPVLYPLFKVKKAKATGENDLPIYEDESRQILFKFMLSPGSEYYPRPDYVGAINYIELDRQISSYHCNNIKNGMFPSHIVTFLNGIPAPEEQGAVIAAWEQNTRGTENAGVRIFSFNESLERATKIEAFPLSDADKQYEFLSEETMMRVMQAHRIVSPLLIGVRDGSGLGSNTDELVTAHRLFMQQVVGPYQELIIEGMEEALGAAGVVPQIEFEQNELPVDIEKDATSKDPVTKLSKAEPVAMSEEDSKYWITRLKTVGETIDAELWELVEETMVHSVEEEREFAEQKLSKINLQGEYANPDLKSKWGDTGLYKLRYAYSQNIDDNSRPFCKEMVNLSVSGTVYRYEDIAQMSDAGVNGQFAPAGSSSYDIFTWKGGVYCHHHWKRQIYFRKRGKDGAFLPNKGLENDKRVGNNPFVPAKGKEGIAPIDTPTRGSLK